MKQMYVKVLTFWATKAYESLSVNRHVWTGLAIEAGACPFLVSLLHFLPLRIKLLSLDLFVFRRKVQKARPPLALERNRSSVGSIVYTCSVQKYKHSSKLNVRPIRPRLSEGTSGENVTDEHVRRPDGDWSKIVQNCMPHTGKHEGHQNRKQVVGKNREKINNKRPFDSGRIHDHLVGIEGVLVGAMIIAWHKVCQGIHNDQAKEGSPDTLHTNQEQRWSWDVHRHDLFLEYKLQCLDEGTSHDKEDAPYRVTGLDFLLRLGRRQHCRQSNQNDRYNIPKYTDPLEAEEVISEDVLLHQGDKDDTAATQHLVDRYVEKLQTHHAKSSGTQIEHRRDAQEEVHPNGKVRRWRFRHFAGRRPALLQKRIRFGRNPAPFGIALLTLHLRIGPLAVAAGLLVNIARKGYPERQDHPVHNNAKGHTDEHAKGLEDGLGKLLGLTGDAGGMHLHHQLRAKGAGRSGHNGGDEYEQLGEATFLLRVVCSSHYKVLVG